MVGSLIVRARRVAGAPVAAIRVWLRGGERQARHGGAALLAGRMLEEGSDSRDWRRVAREAEDRGVSLTAFGGYEAIGLALDGPADETDRMGAWAAELALSPAFAPERWEWQRRLAGAELAAMRDEPETVTAWAFLAQLYGVHPRGRPVQGSEESLARATLAESRESHHRALAAGAVVAVAGAIDEDREKTRLRELFGSLPTGERRPSQIAELPSVPDPRREVALPGDQAHVLLGRRTVDRRHRDLPALELLGVVLGAGAGLAGRIPERVREREGLAYTASVDTAAGASADPGRLVLYAATAPGRADRVEVAMREEVERLVTEGASRRELTAARTYLEGREIFRRETARQWADLLAEAAFTGIPLDSADWAAERWAGATAESIRDAGQRWLDPRELVVTVGLPDRGRRDSPG